MKPRKNLWLISFLLTATVIPDAEAQSPTSALMPTQLATASKVFISNAGEQDNVDCLRAYKEFYAGVAALNRLHPVLDPSTADLILELHYVVQVGNTSVTKGNGNSSEARQFRLALIDPKTHVILWTVVESENSAIFQSNRNKNLDSAMSKLVDDLDNLTAPNPAPPQQKQKQRVR